jgi:hypothetical protein
MSLEESDIGSDHLSNLDTSLDEDQILESLSRLRLEIFRIETTTGPSRRRWMNHPRTDSETS